MSGRLILMGSGELSPTMVATHRWGLQAAGTATVTVLDTPFGFQENADQLTERITRYFRTSLSADVVVAGLRRADAPAAARTRALTAVERARYVFSGPGSPSYAVSAWKAVGMGEALQRRLTAGATVTLASAAALTAGTKTIPVYEIYKAGADPFWLEGLHLCSPFGLAMVVVPHWNNSEGGTHDTSRCFIGRRRFRALADVLDVGVVGVDEHTAVCFDFAAGSVRVAGVGSVTLRGREEVVLVSGQSVSLAEARELLGAVPSHPPPPAPPKIPFDQALADGDLDAAVAALLARLEAAAEGGSEAQAVVGGGIVALAELARRGLGDPRDRVAGFVEALLEWRSSLRREGRWEEADRVRERLGELGVEVRDRPEGPEWKLR